jgi:Ni/Co efflux regulator RcnB
MLMAASGMLAVSLAFAPCAMAQPAPQDHGQYDQNQQNYQDHQDHGRADQGRADQGPGPQAHDNQGHDDQGHHDQGYARAAPPHEAMDHHWHDGGRYTGSRHVVHDWDQRHLRRPPHGYEWVQNGNQFVLIAIGSGIIASIIASQAY